MANRPKRTPEKNARFLGMLRAGHNITEACRRAGYSYQSVKRWRREDPEFSQAVDDAYEQGTDVQAGALERRGWQGWDEPQFYKGRIVGTKRVYSDTASIFSLKQRDPKRFNERLQLEHGGMGGGPLQIIQKVYHVRMDGAVCSTRQPVVIEGNPISVGDLTERLLELDTGNADANDVPNARGEPVRIIRKTYLLDDMDAGPAEEPQTRSGPVTRTIKRQEL